jgi:hypothetical protein
MGLTSGAAALKSSLDASGVKSVSALTSYQPVGDQQVHRFLDESGYTLETQLGKPVFPINVATIWHALRVHGIQDKFCGKAGSWNDFDRATYAVEAWRFLGKCACSRSAGLRRVCIQGFNPLRGDGKTPVARSARQRPRY